nr:hypothetical protein GCM10025732_29610 [Glycomyces mayteni]
MSTAWSDSPITSRDKDDFGRASYAAHTAKLIAKSHSWEDSIVFGLTGPWGSGKSSMLNLIEEALEEAEGDWCIARFTPWATGDVAGLLGDFYASLNSALPEDPKSKVRDALGALAKISVPAAKLIPVVGDLTGTTITTILDAVTKQPPWSTTFSNAVSALKEAHRPVLVIADDIDRLQTEELLTLLKVVRLLGRFPGVQYLLAYDDETLFRTLSSANLADENTDASSRFMEKIIQYPLVVPPLLRPQLLNRLNEGIELAFADAERDEVVGDRLGGLIDVCLSQLSTPRAVDRFLAQLHHHLPLVPKGEIDDEDVIILTLLRTAFPTLYTLLPVHKQGLIRGYAGEPKISGSDIKHERFNIEPLLDKVSTPSRGDAQALLEMLFPNLRELWSQHWEGLDGRICNENYFDRYFAMTIPAYDVSDRYVYEALTAATLGEGSLLNSLLTQANPEQVMLVVAKSKELTNTVVVGENQGDKVTALLETVISSLDRVTLARGHSEMLAPVSQVTLLTCFPLCRMSTRQNQ